MQQNKQNKIHIVFGTTASGKTELAVKLAKEIGDEATILNADSMQIYKEIPIITNQPTEQEKQGVPHHLFGIKSITEHSDLDKWLKLASAKVGELQAEGKEIIFVGGTGMYLKAIIEGVVKIPDVPRDVRQNILQQIEYEGIEAIYQKLISLDKDSNNLKPHDTQRVIRALEVFEHTGKSIFDWQKQPPQIYFSNNQFTIHFIEIDREQTYQKINDRFKLMIEQGAVEEAIAADKIFAKAIEQGAEIGNLPAHKAHGLRELIAYSKNEISLEEAIEKGAQATRNYAKRQLTWWRGWNKSLKDVEVQYH